MTKPYSLRKARYILKTVYTWFKKKGNNLDNAAAINLEKDLRALDSAVLEGNREAADPIAKKLELFSDKNIKKGFFEYSFELLSALVFALIIATVVRQMWFEPYEIPTGSMRPTFKEQDHLTVTKTAFALNVPLKTAHFYFDPTLMQRTSVVIFSGDGIPLPETESYFLSLFPYTKRYIKRCMGKPGDSLYFYGGQVYAIDKDGNPIEELLSSPWLKKLDHIPFLSFRGQISKNGENQFIFSQMHQPLGRINLSRFKPRTGEVFNGKEWIKDNPLMLKENHSTIQTYSDFIGIKNFAMTRLVTKQELLAQKDLDLKDLQEAPLYLEINHTPTVALLSHENEGTIRRADDLLGTFKAYIPLSASHLKKIMDNMYTARFVVSNEKATRYSAEKVYFGPSSPAFKGVENGTYEFYYGKAYKIGFGGIATLLDTSHPLYSQKIENIQRLYNLGIEFNKEFEPRTNNQNLFPSRYGYFRDGDFYLLGGIIFEKNDPLLISFLEKEKVRQNSSSNQNPYIAFKDYGAPIKEGKYDTEFIRSFGITIPEKNYLVLGDNHAMSADSRVFGFVPENNMEGAPSLILWPPGERWGIPAQKPYPLFVFPRLVVWSIAGMIGLIAWMWHERNKRRSIFK